MRVVKDLQRAVISGHSILRMEEGQEPSPAQSLEPGAQGPNRPCVTLLPPEEAS